MPTGLTGKGGDSDYTQRRYVSASNVLEAIESQMIVYISVSVGLVFFEMTAVMFTFNMRRRIS